MTTTTRFPQAVYLDYLEQQRLADAVPVDAELPSWLANALEPGNLGTSPAPIIECLTQLLRAKQAVWQAAVDTTLAADELRRYQKYAKPGQPSAHTVQLRQKQAAARQASSISRQSYIKAATAFVREAHLEVPPRVTIDVFVTSWINKHLG